MLKTVVFIALFLPVCLLAQKQGHLDIISTEHGLSQGFVPSIAQDDDGFLWFATKNGLNRYDGYDFQVFRNDPFDSLSLIANELLSVTALGDFLFVATPVPVQKFELFDRKTQCFFHIQNPLLPNGSWFLKIFPAGKNAVCLLASIAGVLEWHRISWPPDAAQKLRNGQPAASVLTFEKLPQPFPLYGAELSADGKKYWLLGARAILEKDIDSGETRQIPLPEAICLPENADQVTELDNSAFAPELAGATWVCRGQKLARFDGQNWQVFPLTFSSNGLISADRKNGLLWLQGGSEVFGIDLKKTPFEPQPVHRLSVPEGATSGFTDNFGNLWLGTNAHGIRKFIPRLGIFKNYFEGVSVYCLPLENGRGQILWGDTRVQNGRVVAFLGSQMGSALQDFKVFAPSILRADTTAQAFLENSQPAIWGTKSHAYATAQGQFWFLEAKTDTSDTADFVRLDPTTGEKEVVRTGVPILMALTPASMKSVNPSQVWFASVNRIARFDIATRAFSVFENPRQTEKNVYVNAFERSPDGTWWIGSLKGLLKIEPTAAGGFQFSTILPEPGNRNGLRSQNIKSLLCDPADPDVLWIGTDGHGMSRWDRRKNQFTHFTTKNGLPDDVVYGILADDETPRKLWISTNRGLTRFSPETGNFQYFFKSDGLPDNEFNSFAAAKRPLELGGEMLFGTVNGLTVFNPKDLAAQTMPARTLLSAIEINGVRASPRDPNPALKTDIAFLEHLKLPFSQNNLVLHFASSDLSSPARNQFTFWLEGAEQPWAHRSFEHSAQYLNLAPGRYTFWVKSANSSGVWSEQPVSLKITILAPWYQSWPAWFLYAGLLFGAVFLIYKNQLRQKLEHAEAARLRGLDDFKNRFFTNITHEFRTPLTVILGNLELEKREVEKLAQVADPSKISKIAQFLSSKNTISRRNAESLLRLINQILDLAKLESNSLKINYVRGDVLPYLRYIAESLHSLANAQNLMLRVESTEAAVVMDYDPERLLQIVHNLLSNAIKFTPSGGRVVLRLSVAGQNMENLRPAALLTVSDTGTGISPEELPQVFDRFFQAKNQEKSKAGGTGIGLSLTRELVRAMDGEISVESTVGTGSVFLVKLPIHQDAPPPNLLKGEPPVESIDNQAFWESTPLSGGWGGGQNSSLIPHSSSLIPHSSSLPHLLIVEDNPDVVEYLADCLREKYQLDFAYNGRAGIEKALENIPDLIISDVMMPEKDGYEVCNTLKNDERTSHIPIILLTAKADLSSKIAGLRRGADAYLSKPFDLEELLVSLEMLVEKQKRVRAYFSQKSQIENPAATPPQLDEAIEIEDLFVQKIRQILEKNIADEDFGLPQLCQKVGMSRSQLFRKLKALIDVPPSDYIRTFRLQKAKEFLEKSEMNVAEAAFAVGFKDPSYFSKIFQEEYGIQPSATRK